MCSNSIVKPWAARCLRWYSSDPSTDTGRVMERDTSITTTVGMTKAIPVFPIWMQTESYREMLQKQTWLGLSCHGKKCVFFIAHVCVLFAQSCLTICNFVDLSGSSVHGILQAIIWSGLPFPSPGHLPNTGIEPGSPMLQADPFLFIIILTKLARNKWRQTPSSWGKGKSAGTSEGSKQLCWSRSSVWGPLPESPTKWL